MARAKKNQSKKASHRPKGPAQKDAAGSTNNSPGTLDTPKQAKPNLQPAKFIKRPEPVPPLTVQGLEASLAQPAPRRTADTPVAKEAPKQSAAHGGRYQEKVPKKNKKKSADVSAEEKPAAGKTPEAVAIPLESSISSTHEAASAGPDGVPAGRKKMFRVRRRRLMILAAILLFGTAGWFIYVRSDSGISEENRKLIAEVSSVAILPKGETPGITTVIDEARVNQPFLYGTKKGDKVLLYFQAGKAIVYRPSSHQIVNMGPLETPKARVFIRNGSADAGAPGTIENKITASTDYLVASRDESAKKSYQKTIVIDVSGVRPDVAKRLAEYLGARVGSLPEGESRPDSDLMVIVGNDQTTP